MAISSSADMTSQLKSDIVTRRVQDIIDKAEGAESTRSDDDDSSSDEEKPTVGVQVRGKRIGNRFWKTDRKRFSSVVATRGIKLANALEKKNKLREELKHARQLSQTIKAERDRMKQEKRERRKENLKKKEENSRKSEIVQVISNPAKLKRLKKKQLRSIEKRDTSGKK